MDQEEGLSGEDAQYAICTGQSYGGKSWSVSERQEACQYYEQLTGQKVNVSSAPQGLDVTGIVIILAILAATGFVLYRIRSSKKR